MGAIELERLGLNLLGFLDGHPIKRNILKNGPTLVLLVKDGSHSSQDAIDEYFVLEGAQEHNVRIILLGVFIISVDKAEPRPVLAAEAPSDSLKHLVLKLSVQQPDERQDRASQEVDCHCSLGEVAV